MQRTPASTSNDLRSDQRLLRPFAAVVFGLAVAFALPGSAGAACGDGIVTAGEQCDDSNTASGDCCSASCQYEAADAACPDDGSLCTTDLCDGAGTCVHAAGNAGTLCREAVSTSGPLRVPAGVLEFPFGIDETWFSSQSCSANSTLRVLPTSSPSCTAAHVYTQQPATAANFAATINGLTNGTFTAPAAEAGVTSFNFISGTFEASLTPLQLLYASRKQDDSWRVLVAVYQSTGCGSVGVSRRIVGFATANVFRVQSSPRQLVELNVDCNVIRIGQAGGPNYGTVVASESECDLAEYCDGVTAQCPGDAKVPAGTACSDDSRVCTIDVCDVAGNCHFAGNAGTPCRSPAAACESAGTCTGTDGICPENTLAAPGTVCRSAFGSCDVAETCNGTSASCPADQFLAAATACRDSAGVCDVAESCSGSSSACPPDSLVPSGTDCDSDGNVCTDDVCDGSIPDCQHLANSAACSDGLFCNGADSCSGGTCSSHDGNPCPGPDDDGDCAESCDEGLNGCAAGDPDDTICNDGNVDTRTDRCLGGTCVGTDLAACGEVDGHCPADCSIENDADCETCLTRSIVLSDCNILVSRRRQPESTDRLRMRCSLETCEANAGISVATEGIGLTLADTDGVCFSDSLPPASCRQRSTGTTCRPESRDDAGIRRIRLRALSDCRYSMSVRLTNSDLTCLESTRSPWVPTLVVGDDCGDIGCPLMAADRALCAGTCGDQILDVGEQCDGPADGDCPGRCDATCTCL